MAYSKVNDDELKQIRDVIQAGQGNKQVRAWQIKDWLEKNKGFGIDESTIRGRFCAMGEPLGGGPVRTQTEGVTIKEEVAPVKTVEREEEEINVPGELTPFIPKAELFEVYVERDIDRRLALAYDLQKHPLTQGKQGTGKTFGHMYYAFKKQLPFFLVCCYPDMKLYKLFGDKTIVEGSVVFKEGLLVKMIQSPSVILFDEVNYITNSNSVDFHALLQNRELFVKDANNGNGKVYDVHPQCRIGFAQNPRSAKYVGPNIKPASFVGRCTYITYPEFQESDITGIVTQKYGKYLSKDDIKKFVKFYFACIKAIEQAEVPVDFSIRQLQNVIEFFVNGLELKYAIEDGMISMLEAVSQPKAKESFWRLAQATWQELAEEDTKGASSGGK